MSERFDLIVIGAGSAARDAANTAARKHGARVALIEKERWGGSCPNVACQPTKAYLVAAELRARRERACARIGVEAGRASVDLARLYAWKQSLKKPQEQWVEELRANGLRDLHGRGDVPGCPDGRRSATTCSTADRILIASGSRTAVPPIEGLEEVDWLDHVSALELTQLPESLLVVGGGPVGLEFGQMFARFGSRVTIVDGGRPDRAALRRRGRGELAGRARGRRDRSSPRRRRRASGARDERARSSPTARDEYEVRAAQILLASGRVPNLEGLDLEALGVETTQAGSRSTSTCARRRTGSGPQATSPAIAQFTPVAQYQARIAVDGHVRRRRAGGRLLGASRPRSSPTRSSAGSD